MENTYIIQYSKENYKKDYSKYFLYSRRKYWYQIIGLLILFTLIYFLSLSELFDFNLESVLYPLGGLIIGFLLFEALSIILGMKSINKTAKRFLGGSENLIIESTSLKLTFNKIKSESIFYSQIKECLILKGTLFIIFKNKKEWPARINKSEISERGYLSLIEKLKSKNITIKEG